jgi:outer membrane biosynthesis protein TonB
MTAQSTTRTIAGSLRHRAAGAASTGTGPTRTGGRVRGRALLAVLGLALAAAVLPVTTAHASPQAPDLDNQLTNPGGNPQPPTPPEPPDVPDWGPQDLANPTEDPDPPLPPDPPGDGPDDVVNPTENPEPPNPNPTGDPDPVSPGGSSIPTPERVDAGFGGTAVDPHQAAGVALIAAAFVLALLVVLIAHRHHGEARSNR